ncbi:MAG: hypothetical protein CMC83_05565 [Flavobacteriaceae bacterium]|nr:hypothetical protein [Flavobacteriaceae bacterium]
MKNLVGLFMFMSFVCFMSFNLLPTTIDDNGIIHEPFFLIPMSWLFAFFSMLMLTLKFLKKIK